MYRRSLVAGLAAAALTATAASPSAAGTVIPGPRALPIDQATVAMAPEVERLGGADRYTTAVAASRAAFDDAGGPFAAGAVVLARSDSYADSLAAAPLASAVEGPLLLTQPGALRGSTEAEIDRLLDPGQTVYVLGGTPAISPAVAGRLTSKGYVVKRLQGRDRYATAVAIAEELEEVLGFAPTGAAVTTGTNFPDGLAAGAGAGAYLEPVLLTNGSVIPGVTRAYLDANPQLEEVAAVGAAAAAADYAFDAMLYGRDRYETAAVTADYYFGHPDNPTDVGATVGLATGTDWPDALAASGMLALYQGPLLLTRKDALPAVTAAAVEALETRGDTSDVTLGFVFGSSGVVSAAVENSLRTAVAR